MAGLLGHCRSLLQFGCALLGGFDILLCLLDVLADALLHVAEAVLQLANDIGAVAVGQRFLIVAAAKLPQLARQLAQRHYEVPYDTAAAQDEQQQTDDDDGQQRVAQPVVATQHLYCRAYQRHAPLCSGKRTIEHYVLPAIHRHLHVADVSTGHLVTQGYDVGILLGVGGGEDGFLHKAPNGEKMPSAATEDAEIDLKYGNFKKNGVDTKSVNGMIKIRVNQKINNVDTELEIPVHMFASEYTNSGAKNPAFESIEKIMNEYVFETIDSDEEFEKVAEYINSFDPDDEE